MVISLLILSGCTAQCEPVIRDVRVEVPIAVEAPSVPDRPLPTLPIGDITDGSPNDVVVKKYASSIVILKNEIKWYRSVIYKDKN
jgi:hypothetical protein